MMPRPRLKKSHGKPPPRSRRNKTSKKLSVDI